MKEGEGRFCDCSEEMSEIKLCECGCGHPAPIASRTFSKRGIFKGEPVRFLPGHNISPPVEKVSLPCEYCGIEKEMYPSDAKRFKYCTRKCQGHALRESTIKPVGSKHMSNGYIFIKTENGWIQEHRFIMECVLGRPLTDDEEVHHINEVKHDNRLENLEVLSKVEHRRLHQQQWLEEKTVDGKRKCGKCEEMKLLKHFTKKNKGKYSSICKDCYNNYRRNWRNSS
jgi:hypothetical protein